MVGSAIALLVNFPNIKDQAAQIVAHAPSIVAVVSMVMAAAVLAGVLTCTGVVEAMSAWLVQIIPTSIYPFVAVITGQPFPMQSPLVPAILLLVSLAKVDLGDHHKKVLWRSAVVSLVMLGIGMLTGTIGIG